MTDRYEQYVWSARYIDAPVLRRHDADGDGTFDATYYYTTDANQNVTAELSGPGTVAERYAYTPYGTVECLDANWANGQADPRNANPILFCGYFRDAETGLYHVRNRMYDVSLGRWLQRDPAGYQEVLSLYAYCSASPAGNRDPEGLREYPPVSFQEALNDLGKGIYAGVAGAANGVADATGQIWEGTKDVAGKVLTAAKNTYATGKAMAGDAILHWTPPAVLAMARSYLRTCAKGHGHHRGLSGSGGVVAGKKLVAGVEGGVRLVAFCDTCEVCAFAYGVGTVGGGVGAGGGAAVGFLDGKNTFKPDDYAGFSHGVEFGASLQPASIQLQKSWGHPYKVDVTGSSPVAPTI